MVRLVALLLLSPLLSGPALAAQDPAARLSERLEGMESFTAGFSRLTRDDLTEETGGGYCWLQRPLRFRWRVDEPIAQLLVSDGETLWTHDPELEQVVVQRLAEQLEGSPAALLTGETRLVLEQFRVEFRAEGGGELFTLTPLDADSLMAGLEIGFLAGRLHRLLLSDPFGQTSEFRFHDPLVNEPLPDELFRFVMPPGTDVIRDF